MTGHKLTHRSRFTITLRHMARGFDFSHRVADIVQQCARHLSPFSLVHLQGSAVDDPEKAMTRKPSDQEPFSGLAFKVMADQFLGTLTFVRVYRCDPPRLM